MKIKAGKRAVILLGAGLALGWFSVAGAADEDGLRIEETYNAWVRTVNAKDIEKWSSFLARNAYFTPPDSPSLTTEAAILNHYRELFSDPEFSLDCKQLEVEVADSAEMAWARGTCSATFTDSDGNVGHGKSRWFKVWVKQSDGSWKCRINTWNNENLD
jgi:ketosteroid isomerase-like protein